MGGKLSKKVLSVAYEKPTAQRVDEEPTEAAAVKPEKSEEAHPAAESMEATIEKDQNSHVSADETDQEGGGIPAVHPKETCKSESRQLDVAADEEQLVAIASVETIKPSEADPAQLLEVLTPKGVESRQGGDAE